MRGSQRVHGKQAQRGLAVNEDNVVLRLHVAQHAGQGTLTRDLVHELHLGGGQVDIRREDIQVFRGCLADCRVNVGPRVHEQRVDSLVHVEGINPQAHGCGTLRIEVNDQHAATVLSQRGTQVDRGRRFTDATLLVTHRDHACGSVAHQGRGHRKIDLSVGQIVRQRRMRILGHVTILGHWSGISLVPRARGCESVKTSRRAAAVTAVYICVVATEACPSSSCTSRTLAPPSRRWVANE